MKKSMMTLAALLTAVALTSCSNDSIDEKNPNVGDEIVFKVGSATRGTPVTTATLTGFDVFAFKSVDKSTYIDGGAFTKNTDNEYTGTTTYYWPSTGNLDFYAIAPGKTAITIGANEGITGASIKFSYTASTTNADQVDLMTVWLVNHSNPNTATSPTTPPNLTFNHLLSQVTFQGYVESTAGFSVDIKGITLHNVTTTGSCTDGISLVAPTTNAIKGNYPVTLPSTSVTLGKNSDSPTPLTAAAGALMLVPQTLTPWDTNVTTTANDNETNGSKNAYINVQLVVKNGSDALLGSDDIPADVYIPLGATWEAGKHYTYTLRFGSTAGSGTGIGYIPTGEAATLGTTGITLRATVTDWDDQAATVINF